MKQPGILIIFARNLVYGQVKTRLAASAGADAAFEVYKKLLQHTNAITQNIHAAKIVYYSEHVETDDLWNNTFMRATQKGHDLGERMFNAFEETFQRGYSKAVMIGTDCP